MNDANARHQPAQHVPQPYDAILEYAWAQFNDRFRTSQDCLEEICTRLEQAGLVRCPFCGNEETSRNYGQRVARCMRCYKRFSVTAGTFFHHMKAPKAWLAAILLTGQGITVSSAAFHKRAGIAQSSSHQLLTKVRMAIQYAMPDDAEIVPSGLFAQLFSKRSRQTPAGAHPQAEQAEIDKQAKEASTTPEGLEKQQNDGQSPDSATACPDSPAPPDSSAQESPSPTSSTQAGSLLPLSFSPLEQKVYELLGVQDLHFDQLTQLTGATAGAISAALTMLELQALIKALPGNIYARSSPEPSAALSAQAAVLETLSKESQAAVFAFESLGAQIFHGISRKLVQPYLAAFWCHIDRPTWSANAVFSACLRAGPLRYRDILAYVSPPLVKFAR
jgi:transposase-like protein